MSLSDNYAASLDPRMIASLTSAIYAYAEQIYTTEASPGPRTNKSVFAVKVMTGQVQLQPLITSACAFASLTANSASPSTDQTINNTVATMWPVWSNA